MSAGRAAPPLGREVDRDALDRLRAWGGDPLIRAMAQLFFEDVPALLSTARAAAASGDAASLAGAMHVVKSSAPQIGAARAGELAAEIERRARGGDATELAPLVEETGRALARFRRALDDELRA